MPWEGKKRPEVLFHAQATLRCWVDFLNIIRWAVKLSVEINESSVTGSLLSLFQFSSRLTGMNWVLEAFLTVL